MANLLLGFALCGFGLGGAGIAEAEQGYAQSADAPAAPPADVVVLVHGMGRTPLSMLPLELFLERRGYRVVNFGYSSYGPDIEQISDRLGERLSEELGREPASRVDFVGHSLGNIVIRSLLGDWQSETPMGRFVMLAPPNQGSATADRMAPYVGWLLAPIRELRTTGSTVLGLPALEGVEFAIVSGASDRKVSVAESCLAGARAHLLVPSAHTFIMLRPGTQRLIAHFLSTGEVGEEAERVPEGSCFVKRPATIP